MGPINQSIVGQDGSAQKFGRKTGRVKFGHIPRTLYMRCCTNSCVFQAIPRNHVRIGALARTHLAHGPAVAGQSGQLRGDAGGSRRRAQLLHPPVRHALAVQRFTARLPMVQKRHCHGWDPVRAELRRHFRTPLRIPARETTVAWSALLSKVPLMKMRTSTLLPSHTLYSKEHVFSFFTGLMMLFAHGFLPWVIAFSSKNLFIWGAIQKWRQPGGRGREKSDA